VVGVLKYMHKKNIAHGDVSTNNVIINIKKTPKSNTAEREKLR
jgi:tRNA A-37 threonylcarbamoyl transferase component Bud32